MRNIYWGGVTPQARNFDPFDAQYWDWSSYLTADPGLCGQGGRGQGFASAFDSALALETQEQWPEAQAAYLTIAGNEEYAIGDRTMAAARAVMVDRETQALSLTDMNELASAMEADAAELRDSLAVERVRLCHATDEAGFPEALDGYENLLERELTVEDSLLTVIDIFHVQMLAGSGGNLDAALEPRNAAYAVHSSEEGVRMVNAAMNALMGVTAGQHGEPPIPTAYALYQNYPNPFNPTTEIRFDLPENAHVELTVFNTLGQRVATVLNETKPAGTYRVPWDGSGVASGVYLYQLAAGNFTDSKKMVLMK